MSKKQNSKKSNQAGKGSSPRPVNYKNFSKNWDVINWGDKKSK